MLLLIEPPGTKHHDVTGSDAQRGQHLLEYSTPEEDEEPDSDDIAAPTSVGTVTSCAQVTIRMMALT